MLETIFEQSNIQIIAYAIIPYIGIFLKMPFTAIIYLILLYVILELF